MHNNICWWGEGEEGFDEVILFSLVLNQSTQNEIQKLPLQQKEKFFHCEGSQTLAQVAQPGCGVSILGDIRTPAGHSQEQPVLAVSALNWVGGLDDLQGSLPFCYSVISSTILLFCDSVIIWC